MTDPEAPRLDPAILNARTALLDALQALGPHRESVVLVGAQAVYLHTGSAAIALAEFTTDADLAIDTRTLGDDPQIEAAMAAGGFIRDPTRNPGVWTSRTGVQVDLMVPAAIAGSGRRSVNAPPHDSHSMRKSLGLEAALVDNEPVLVTSLDDSDTRAFTIAVAGPAALLVAKLHKLHERIHERRSVDSKDAHDVYRLLVAIPTEGIASRVRRLLDSGISHDVTRSAIASFEELFASSASAPGARMAGDAERYVGDPDQVALAANLLAADLLNALSL